MENKPTGKQADAGDQPKQLKQRSPAYPAIDLESALKKAAILWEKAKRHSVPISVAAEYWELDAKSSSVLSSVSALKKFGLVDELEGVKERTFKLSDFGIRLVFNTDQTSDEYKTDLKEAALRPSIHAQLWSKYGGNLPDDKVIERYLVLERKFNGKYVTGFIEEFRRTIAFANLLESDTLPDSVNTSTTERPAIIQKGASPLAAVALEKQQGNQSEVPIFLGDGRFVKIPTPLSEEDYDFLINLLKSYKSRLVKPVKPLSVLEQLDQDILA